jgi:hypothetical protein
MKTSIERANELVELYYKELLKYASATSKHLGFSRANLDENDAASHASLKIWQLAQTHGHLPDDEFCKLAKTSIKNALKTLLRDTLRHMICGCGLSTKNVSGSCGKNRGTEDEEDTEETREEITTQPETIEETEEYIETFSFMDPEAFAPPTGFFVDPAFEGKEMESRHFNFDDREYRLRTAQVIHAILTETTPAKFDRWLPLERRGRVKGKDLLTPGEQFVLRTYGAGMKAVDALEEPDAQKLKFNAVNDVTNCFLRGYKRMWKILEKLGFHWIDLKGAFRGQSLDEGEWRLAFLSAQMRECHPRAFCLAMIDLYNSVEIDPP